MGWETAQQTRFQGSGWGTQCETQWEASWETSRGQVGDTVKEKWVTKRRQGGGHGAKHSDRQAGKQVRDKVEGGDKAPDKVLRLQAGGTVQHTASGTSWETSRRHSETKRQKRFKGSRWKARNTVGDKLGDMRETKRQTKRQTRFRGSRCKTQCKTLQETGRSATADKVPRLQVGDTVRHTVGNKLGDKSDTFGDKAGKKVPRFQVEETARHTVEDSWETSRGQGRKVPRFQARQRLGDKQETRWETQWQTGFQMTDTVRHTQWETSGKPSSRQGSKVPGAQ